jgi:hypothetical protein
MKITLTLLAALLMGANGVAAQVDGAPKIQFDQTVYDFGKTSVVTAVSGVFKFKNIGDGVLKIQPPKPSCGCTVAELKSDTLLPNATGELTFTLNLNLYKGTLEKHISVKSNDPQTPEVGLSIKVDYTPLFDLTPMTLAPNLAFGENVTTQFTTLTRTDGKPLHIVRLDASQPWITATVDPATSPEGTNARICVTVQRNGLPRRFNEHVQVYTAEITNAPASSLYLYGQIAGEVVFSPEALYWSIPDTTNAPTDRPESMVLRRVAIHSASGQPLDLKRPQSTIKGINVELVTKEAGRDYELVVRLGELPTNTISGNVSFETSVAAQPKIEVPVIVNVFKL